MFLYQYSCKQKRYEICEKKFRNITTKIRQQMGTTLELEAINIRTKDQMQNNIPFYYWSFDYVFSYIFLQLLLSSTAIPVHLK